MRLKRIMARLIITVSFLVISIAFTDKVAFSAVGDLDPAFGTSGVIMYDGAANNDDFGLAVVVQPDGKILVAGSSSNGSNEDVLLMRFNADGARDMSFGTAGLVTYNGTANGNDAALALMLQPNGKILIAGLSSNGTNMDGLLMRYNADGFLDTNFGNAGVMTYDGAGMDWDTIDAITLQPDGKIVVAGYSASAASMDLLLMRFDPDGTLDTTFGNTGILTYSAADGTVNMADAVVLQPNGKIVVAAHNYKETTSDFLLLRYNADGTPDTSFGTAGVVRHNTSGGFDFALAVALQSDGKILIAGDSSNATNTNYDLLLLRYNSDGTPDTSFGTAGVVTYDAGVIDACTALSVQPDGLIMVSGFSQIATDHNVLLLRYNSDGTLDTSFGTAGVVTVTYDNPANGSEPRGLRATLQPDGKFVVAASKWNGANYDLLLLRLVGQEFSSVTLISPNGAELIASGSLCLIRWSAPSAAQTFTLKYSIDNGVTWTNAVGTDSINSFIWEVPSFKKNKKRARVKLIGYDFEDKVIGKDVSDAMFTIEAVSITSPTGLDTLRAGIAHTIKWRTAGTKGIVDSFKLLYTKDAGITWKPIHMPVAGEGNPGTYLWDTIPVVTTSKTKSRIKLILKDSSGNIIGEAMSNFFMIQ